MTLLNLQNRMKEVIRSAARDLFDVELDQLNAETPPKPELGDLAFPVSFELAKLVKQKTGEKVAPRSIAEKLKARLETITEVSRVEIAGPGYINIFFDRPSLLRMFNSTGTVARLASENWPKKMVEHTSINPNKA